MTIKLDTVSEAETEQSKLMGRRIRDKRTEKGLSLSQLSQITGISKSTLQQYESGNVRKIGADKRKALAEALGLDENDLNPSFMAAQNFFANWETDRKAMLSTLSAQFGDDAVSLVLTYNELPCEYQKELSTIAENLLKLSRYELLGLELEGV